MSLRKHTILSSILVIAGMLLAACGSSQPATSGTTSGAATTAPAGAASAVTIKYQLWDSAQKPAYEQCSQAFTKKNPNIVVNVQQLGWDDYWSGIQTGFVSGAAPDVFTNHLAKYPEFANKKQLVDIEPLVQKDKIDTGQYIKGLAELWTRDGKRYGLPKDWDTIAVIYNNDMIKKAGVDPASLKDLTWNPDDGGSFQKLIAQLTLDSNGKNGLDPAFDKTKVVQYGFIPQGAGGGVGQTQWANFAVSAGFKFIDSTWGTKYYYDDPILAKTMQWYADLALVHGFAPPVADISSLGAGTLFKSAKGALTTDGSWQINGYVNESKFKVGFAPLPKGPQGRKSMFNGLGDSIWVGSKHQNEAWEWVKFAASKECEDIVGTTGVVFPAIQSGVDNSLKAKEAKGIDATAFTDIATEDGATFLFPITDHAAEISSIMGPVMDSIMLGQTKAADTLPAANEQVNALFK